MFPEKSRQSDRPSEVATAFGWQLAIAGLLAVVAVSGVLAFRSDPFAGMPGSVVGPIVLLAQAVWLTAAACGLRRGSRVAHRLSLAGLVLPTLAMAALLVLIGAGGVQISVSSWNGDAVLPVAMTPSLFLLTTVIPAAAFVELVLAGVTVSMLLTRAARRFFAGVDG